MFGDNPLVFEGSQANSEPHLGIRTDLGFPVPPLNQWLISSSGLPLGSGTAPNLGINAGSAAIAVTKWDHDETAILQHEFFMPREWAERQNELVLTAQARKVDSSTDENADLALSLTVSWVTPAGAAVLLDTIDVTLPAAATNTGAFSNVVFDIGAALRAESKTIPGGSRVVFQFGPNEAVGATDMDLEVANSLRIQWRRHAAFYNRSDRGI